MKTFDVDVERRVSQIRTFPITAETAEEAGRLALNVANHCGIGWLECNNHISCNVMYAEEVKK